MQINGLENISQQQLDQEIARGGKFVIYDYCISLLIITLKRSSGVYFIRAGESAVTKGLGFTVLTLVLGWWGFPWGPIYTIASLYTNFRGGRDVTHELVSTVSYKQNSSMLDL